MSYTAIHAAASRTLARKGAIVVFTRETPGVYDPGSDTWTTPTTTSIAGKAIRVQGKPDTYAALGLVQSAAPSLFFVPDAEGSLPTAGFSVTWGGHVLTVMDCDPLEPDGVAIAATIVCVR